MSDEEDILQRFKLVCRKCGSENVKIDIEEGQNYGGDTGYGAGHLAIGCNDCGDNDFWMSL
jgi:hypothetical protein